MSRFGYFWQQPQGIEPIVGSVGEARNARNAPPAKYAGQSHAWIFSYSFSDAGIFRAGRADGPIIGRNEQTAILIPPRTCWWQDESTPIPRRKPTRKAIHTAWLAIYCNRTNIFEKWIRPRKNIAVFQDEDQQIGSRIEQILLASRQNGDNAFWFVQAQLWHILELLSRYRWDQQNFFWSMSHLEQAALSERVDDYLQSNLAKTIRLRDVAEALKISVSTLSHRYTEQTGISPMNRLIEMRITHARRLLMDGMQLSQIVPRTGFVDESHLSRTFKKVTGMTPRQCLAQERKGLPIPTQPRQGLSAR